MRTNASEIWRPAKLIGRPSAPSALKGRLPFGSRDVFCACHEKGKGGLYHTSGTQKKYTVSGHFSSPLYGKITRKVEVVFTMPRIHKKEHRTRLKPFL